jgi:undecaprenyl-diphosphatase
MTLLEAIILGIIEGLTEWLPVSSTGHLTIAEQLMGLPIDDPGITAFTAIIQVGAIGAAILYFWSDIYRLASAWLAGLFNPAIRKSFDYRMGWYVIAGSIPIGVVGLLGRDIISGPLRSLWVVALALILWSGVMYLAERNGKQTRGESDLTLRDALFVGAAQCIALIPGVSRSGATISAGLLAGVDRVTATRLAFFLGIPALTAAGIYEAVGEATAVAAVGWTPTIIATIVSFIAGYASIAWLIRLVAHHSINVFVGYRIVLGLAVIIGLSTGMID